MREISPAVGVSVDDWVKRLSPDMRRLVEEIRRQKREGTRPLPSTNLIDRSAIMTKGHRLWLLDAIATLVDENYAGRSEMCLQFATLLDRALSHLNFPSRGVVGTAIYYALNGEEIFRWKHGWVRVGDEVIDGSVDSLIENPSVPREVSLAPYWGPISKIPRDRRLREEHIDMLPPDVDVENIWWPHLKRQIEQGMLA